jgi:chromosome segregation ATPase
MTKAQEVYDRVEALVATGVKKADAFRQIAEELNQPFNSMRGAYYAHTRTLGGTPARPRKGETNGDPIEQALGLLSRAVESIDTEVADAKQHVDDAKAEYEQLRDTAKERKAAIQAKIDALKA